MYLGGNHQNHSGGYAIIAELYEVFKSSQESAKI